MIENTGAARSEGARLVLACAVVGISLRTYRRWTQGDEVKADGRPTAVRPPPAHQLGEAECAEVLRVCSEPRFVSLPPSQIVPRLADEGVYLASESSFYRVRRASSSPGAAPMRPPARRPPVMRPRGRIKCGVGISRICRAGSGDCIFICI